MLTLEEPLMPRAPGPIRGLHPSGQHYPSPPLQPLGGLGVIHPESVWEVPSQVDLENSEGAGKDVHCLDKYSTYIRLEISVYGKWRAHITAYDAGCLLDPPRGTPDLP